MAGSSMTITPSYSENKEMVVLVVDYVADDTDGTFPNDEVFNGAGYITNAYVQFGAGALAPTDALTSVTVDFMGVDLLGGAGLGMTTSVDALITPTNTLGDMQYAGFVGSITPKITGNVVNSATAQLILVIAQ